MYSLEPTNTSPWEAAGGWHEFKNELGFIVRPYLKNKTEQNKTKKPKQNKKQKINKQSPPKKAKWR